MKRFALWLFSVSSVFMVLDAVAQQPSDIWQYCTANYAGTGACFDSLGAAEAYMRQEDPAGPSGRRFLELTSGPTFSGLITNPTGISYGYAVKPRGPIAYLEDYISAITLGWGGPSPTGITCGCPNADGTGSPVCYAYGNAGCGCTSYACKTQNGDTSGIATAIHTYLQNSYFHACNISDSQIYPWPSPADTSGEFSVNGVNFQGLQYFNGHQGAGDPGEPFNLETKVTFGSLSNGQCGGSNAYYFGYSRQQHIQCDAGFHELGVILNAQDTYPASQVTPISRICVSDATGSITASLIPTSQCKYGNPCVPGNGSKVQNEVDYSFGSVSIGRHYNSIGFGVSNSALGPGWHHDFDSRLIIPNSTSSTYVLLSDQNGDIERFDQQGTTTTYRSVNTPGYIATFVTVGSTTTWQVMSPTGKLWEFDTTGVLQFSESISRPESALTYAYGPLYSSNGSLLVPAGAVASVTDALGRTATFSYATINDLATCSQAGIDPACFGYRLVSVQFPDGNAVSYTYDTSGNLVFVTYPDGNGRKYYYNEPANICPASMPNACTGGTPPAGGFPHLLTGIADVSSASGSPVTTRFSTYQYDYRGRVVSSSQAGGANQLTLSYPSQTQTVLNFAYGNVAAGGMQKTLNFTTVGGIFRKELTSTDKDPVTGAQFVTQYGYDTSGRLQTKTDPLNFQSSYEYSNGLNLTAITEAVGNPLQRRIETDWNDTFNVPTERRIKNASGVETKTDWTYNNASGQMLARCEVDPNVSGASSYGCGSLANAPTGVRQWRYIYCDAVNSASPDLIGSAGESLAKGCPLVGLLRRVVGPRTDVNSWTTYQYYLTADTSTPPKYRAGDLSQVIDVLGHTTKYVGYDANGRATRIQDTNGVYTDMTYHPRGWLLTRTVRANANGTPNAALDATTAFAYDNVGNVKRVTQPDGAYLAYTYDNAHRLTDIWDNIADHIQYTLDAADNRTDEKTRDPSGNLNRALSRQYDQLNRLTKMLNAASATVQTDTNPADAPPTGTVYNNGYDGNGNAIYSVDGSKGVGTEQLYDPLNRLVKTLQDHTGVSAATKDATTQYAYDARNNLRSVIDPDNLTTSYTYDGLNNLTALGSPDTGSTGYTYDAAGNRTTQTDARGVISTYSYDALNRLTGISYPTSTLNVTYSYDQANSVTGCATSYPIGRLTTMTDSTGSTTYCYDQRGNVIRKTQGTFETYSCSTEQPGCGGSGALAAAAKALTTHEVKGNSSASLSPATANPTLTTAAIVVTAYSYTLADRLASITYPSGAIVSYTPRNAIGQITNVTYKANATATPVTLISNATYLPFGPLNLLSFGDGRTLTKNYDKDYAIRQVFSSSSSGLVVGANVDVLGNLVNATSSTIPATTPTQQYQYDPLYRLTNVKDGSGTSLEGFSYDLTGDRLSKSQQGQSAQSYTYAQSTHRLASVAGVSRTYDPNGNTTSSNLSYDNRNRLAGWQLNSDGSINLTGYSALYGYSGRGERVSKQTMQYAPCNPPTCNPLPGAPTGWLTGTEAFSYDEGGRLLGEYPGPLSIGMGTEYIYLDATPIAIVRSGTLYYIETDQLGTPRQVIKPGTTTAADTLVWKWDYFANNSAFGENTPSVQTLTFNLRFPGQYFDSETGLNYNYFRDYEPGTGRYVESDPIGLKGGFDLYAYVESNPFRYADIYGLYKCICSLEYYNNGYVEGRAATRCGYKCRCFCGDKSNTSKLFSFPEDYRASWWSPNSAPPCKISPRDINDSSTNQISIFDTESEQSSWFPNWMPKAAEIDAEMKKICPQCTK